jgi:S1-C subfamily serine protease
VDGVSPERPAERAGILKGDIIIKIGDRAVGDIQDYMNALQRYRKGDSCPVELVRGTDTLTVTVEFK